jgi:cation diffusion facilitator CzcD-associated flavoprotein CzcO
MNVGIIGAGPGGLALGIMVSWAGFDNFTIFDREDGVGGTWRINTYPGLACDVKSHLYSYSFDLNADWSRLWSPQPEILDYFQRCADKYGLRPHMRLCTEIKAAQWDPRAHFRAPNGRVVTQWPRSARTFWGMTRRFRPADFRFTAPASSAAEAVASGERGLR